MCLVCRNAITDVKLLASLWDLHFANLRLRIWTSHTQDAPMIGMLPHSSGKSIWNKIFNFLNEEVRDN